MRQIRKASLLTAALVLAYSPTLRPALAAGLTEIQVSHADGRVRKSDDGVPTMVQGVSLKDSPTILAHKGNKAVVSIVDTNPLLFRYSIKKGTPIKTSNQVELERFADSALGPFVKSLGGGGTLSVKKGQQTLDCSSFLTELAAVAPAIDGAAEGRDRIARESLDALPQARERIGRWQLEQWSKGVSAADKVLGEAAARIARGQGSQLEQDCAGIIAVARGEIPQVQKTLAELRKFKELFDQIGVPVSLDPFTVNIAEDQPIEVEITRTEIFPTGLTSSRFVGKGTFTVSPETRARIVTLAPAMVYSFVRDPTFEAKASGGQFVIQQKENPYKELELAAMMLVEPDAWDLGSVNLGFQLGASPQKALGLFLGLSLRASDLFTFGAGVAYQRVDRLKDGLSIGQTLASQDLLKTEKEFREGLYLHITVTPRKKS
jgi:hypothetical protein